MARRRRAQLGRTKSYFACWWRALPTTRSTSSTCRAALRRGTLAQRIKGYTTDEIVGRHFSTFYTREAVESGWPQHELEVAASVGRFEDEGWRVRKDGSRFWANVVITAVRRGRRAPRILQDHSGPDRAQASEEAVHAANAALEGQVQRRTADLHTRNVELLRSNQELDDFAYIASHDLKEPLRGIHNYANFLIEDYADRLDEEGRAKLKTLTRLSQRMETLLDSLLEFSRVGRVDLAMGRIDLQTLLAEVLESLEISLAEQGVDLRIPRPLPALRMRPGAAGRGVPQPDHQRHQVQRQAGKMDRDRLRGGRRLAAGVLRRATTASASPKNTSKPCSAFSSGCTGATSSAAGPGPG